MQAMIICSMLIPFCCFTDSSGTSLNSNLIDKVRLTGVVTTTVNANDPLGYDATVDITALSGYPNNKAIIARVPMIAYANNATGFITFPSNTQVTVSAKVAATFTFVLDILYKRQ